MSLPDSVQQTLSALIPPGSRLVIGVSGGADSLTLLHVLSRLPPESALELHAATLDHGLRGEAGEADVRFVIQTCEAWGIPVTASARADLPLDTHVESAARMARYDFLAEVAHQVGASFVAVAHHAGDQAETVLMHLIRGAGLQGLSGMRLAAPLPGYPELTLIRPLLDIPRHKIDAYCREHDLQPRLDHTNADIHLLRNRLRLETLPHLRTINPQVEQALTRLAAAAARDQDYLRQQMLHTIAEQVHLDANHVRLPLNLFRSLHPALQYHLVLWAAAQIGGQDVTYDHVARAVDLAHKGHTGQQSPLPGGLCLRLDYQDVVIEQADAPPDFDGPLLPPGAVLTVTIPGITVLPGSDWQLHAGRLPPEDSATSHARLALREGPIAELRTRRQGDRFAPLGLDGHTQTLKKWMIDHKIPQAIRNQIPVLTINGEIAALIIGNQWVISALFAIRDANQSITFFDFR